VIRQRSIDVPWGVVHARTGRSDRGPTIVLLHQTPRSGDEYTEVIDALGDDHHVIALDLPGMGASSPHPDGASIESYADAVAHALRAEAVDDADGFVLVGHHTGAAVAAMLAARDALAVTHVVLSSPPWIDEESRRRRRQRPGPGIDEVVRSSRGDHLAALWRGRSDFYPADRPDLLDRFVADALHAVDPTEGHRAVTGWDMESALPALRQRAVTLVDHVADPHAHPYIGKWSEALPHAQVISIEHGMVPLEFTADAFTRVLLDTVSGT
jgi:pimeloyl-ACP methyl ester carboxylesterase